MAKKKKNENEAPEEELTPAQSLKVDLYFWLQALVMALVLLILTFTLVGRVIGVDGHSMEPTLHNKDMLILQSIGYEPKQGDVVVLTKAFGSVDGPIVKRIIAVGGQTVDIDYDAGTVTVDGQVLDEPYINHSEVMQEPNYPVEDITSITVPEGSIFVMGDNRNHSTDSRSVDLGVVDNRYVLGKALWVVLPFSSFGAVESYPMDA